MIYKNITYFGLPAVIICDERCDLAEGTNKGRIISEGGHTKPQHPDERLNKWCCRECERCLMIGGNTKDDKWKLCQWPREEKE